MAEYKFSQKDEVLQEAINNAIADHTKVGELTEDVADIQQSITSIRSDMTFEDSFDANGHEYVDLGLPSGKLWAKCNVGAESEEGYGNYFMWGSTTPNDDDSCDWAHAPFNNGAESFDEEYFTNTGRAEATGSATGNTLLAKYDAASVNMGGSWRMPDSADLEELQNTANCSQKWTTVNGVNGVQFTSLTNGNSIFIPAAGLRDNTSFDSKTEVIYMWSRTIQFVSEFFGLEPYWMLKASDTHIIRLESAQLAVSVRGVIDPSTPSTSTKVGKKVEQLSQEVEGIRSTVSAMPTTLEDNHIYTVTEEVTGDVTVPEPTASALGITVLFTAGDVDSITFEGSPKWVNEVAGELTSGSMYLLTIIDGIYQLNELVEE